MTTAAASNFYTVIAGIGSGTGRSLALKFSSFYPTVYLLSRSQSSYSSIVDEINARGGNAIGIPTDVTSSSSVKSAFSQIAKAEEGKNRHLAAAIYNVGGKFVRKPFLELTEQEYAAGFEGNGLGLFNFASSTLPLLLSSVSASPPHPPTLLLTGATASLKGSALCASFASGKFAMRATGQSLAREFGPKGVHVAHAVIDGAINTPMSREAGYVKDGDAAISSEAIAENYWWLHTQPRSAWTHEIDVRPYVEKW